MNYARLAPVYKNSGSTTPVPTFNLDSGTYLLADVQGFTITSPSDGTTYITIDGTTPSPSNKYETVAGGDASGAYNLSFPVTGFQVKAIFYPTVGTPSNVVTKTYNVTEESFTFNVENDGEPATCLYTFGSYDANPNLFEVFQAYDDETGETGAGVETDSSGYLFASPGLTQYFKGRLGYADYRDNSIAWSSYSAVQELSVVGLGPVTFAHSDYPGANPGDESSVWTAWNAGSQTYSLEITTPDWRWSPGNSPPKTIAIGYYVEGTWFPISTANAGSTTTTGLINAFGQQVDLVARAYDDSSYRGNPSATPLTTIVPFEPPSNLTGTLEAENMFFTWDTSPTAEAANVGQFFTILNVSTDTEIFSTSMSNTGDSISGESASPTPSVDDEFVAKIRTVSAFTGSWTVPPSTYNEFTGTVV